MKVREICEKIKSGEITIHNHKHSVVEKWQRENILQSYERHLKGEQENKELCKLYLDQEVENNGEFKIGLLGSGPTCTGCGGKFDWVFNGNRLELRGYNDYDRGDDCFVVLGEDHECIHAIRKPFIDYININSKLIFTNFFYKEKDKDCTFLDCDPVDEYTDDYNLNYFSGRINITKYKAKKNVAYGQMGNMSVDVFVHPNKKSIIIGDLGGCEIEESDELEGHKFVGGISLSVWRWEATDLNTLGEERYKELKSQNHMDVVEVDVEHGRWRFEHYYRTDSFDESKDSIYSRFFLEENQE